MTAVRGREAISELFQFEVEAGWQHDDPLDFAALLGQKVTLTIALRDGKRYFNGIVAGITQEGRDELFTYYRITIVPSLWLLTRISHCRIFQNKDVPDIVKSVIRQCGQPIELDPQTTGTYEPARILRAVRRNRFSVHQPPHGRGGHLLLFQVHRDQPYHGVGRRSVRARSRPLFRDGGVRGN